MKELGPTLADIAAAKAGIVKEECPVVSYGGVPEADIVIRRVCAEKHAELTEVDFSRLKYEGGSLDAVEFDFDGLTDVHLPLMRQLPAAKCGAGYHGSAGDAHPWLEHPGKCHPYRS